MDKKKGANLDDVIKEIGQFGTFQLRLFFILLPFNLCSSFYAINVMFLDASPAWYCTDPELRASKWNSLCQEDWCLNLLMSIAFIGAMFGSCVFGVIADKYGRLPTYLIGVVTIGMLSFCVGVFQGNYYLFAVFILLCGFAIQGAYQVCFVLLLEFAGPDKRTLISTMISVCGTVGYMLTPLITYFVPNHRIFYFGLSVVFACVLLTYSYMSESPRWLLSSKNHSKLKSLLDKMAKINQSHYTESHLNTLSDSECKSDEATTSTLTHCADLFTKPHIRSRIGICSFVWFAICSSYYGLSYSARLLEGSIYLNVFLGGLVELPSTLSAYLLLQYQGRKRSLELMTLIISISSFLAVLSSFLSMERLLTIFSLIAKCFVSGTFLILYVYTLELMPTSVRTLGLGVCSIFARIGGISVPLVLAATPDRAYVFLYFSASTFLGALLLMFLPETKGLPMPDSIEQLVSPSTQFRKTSLSSSLNMEEILSDSK